MSIEKDPKLARQLRVKFTKMRIERGLTLDEMARLVGRKKTTYAHYESGRMMPTITSLKKICDALGMKSYEILGF